jgi:ADP-ribosylglycohydrolase
MTMNAMPATIPSTTIPADYDERVYAGVLGKIIGVYLGRPFEGWTYERIMSELGEVNAYVNDRIAHHPPLIVTDDDISGTFTFLRALPDYGNRRDLTAAQIGQTWLNYLIERQTILWWGGMGNSTEHTAYMRLKQGIPAPRSGSIELNTKVVAEQIGAQIFIDGWALVAPGNPALAADLARKAGSVSHDGEALYGAMALAAMEAQAFVEHDMNKLLDTALSVVPPDCLIAQLIGDIRAWRKADNDWQRTRARIEEKYGYDKYGGNCHMIPNHAVIILALVYADDGANPFQHALMIGNTSGWDTDCNSGNIGCLMGIREGLRGIDNGPVDWRGPVADRLYLPTADSGRCVTDAVQEAQRIAQIGRALAGEPADGTSVSRLPRYNFAFPGSVQGFHSLDEFSHLDNPQGGALNIHIEGEGREARVSTATFIPPEALKMPGYGLVASPTLYPGQTIRAEVSSDMDVRVNLFVRVYNAADELITLSGEPVMVRAGEVKRLAWLPEGIDGGSPIAEVGVRVSGDSGTLRLHWLTWDDAPITVFTHPRHNGTLWQRAWVKACDDLNFGWNGVYRICQDAGNGLLIQGQREWANYTVRAAIIPHLARYAGVAACVQGLKRYYALLLCDDQKARLVKALVRNPGVDAEWQTLAEVDYAWQVDEAYALALTTEGEHLSATINDQPIFDLRDTDAPLLSGAVALLISVGRLDCDAVSVAAV